MNPNQAFGPRQDSLPVHAPAKQLPVHRKSLPADESIFAIADRLFRHSQFNEYCNQIFACLVAHPNIWYHVYCLRENPEAAQIVGALHLSIPFVPPSEIWRMLVQLRSHSTWEQHMNHIVMRVGSHLASISTHGPQSHRSSTGSSRSTALFSSGGSLSTRTSTGSINYPAGPPHFPRVDETNELISADNHLHYSQKDLLPQRSPAPSFRADRTAPEGFRFVCPGRLWRGQCSKPFSRQGDYENHLLKHHSEFPDHDPHKYLQKVSDAVQSRSGLKTEADQEHQQPTEMTHTIPALQLPQVIHGSNDPVPTGHEYQFEAHQLSNVMHNTAINNIEPPLQYYQGTGVHVLDPDMPGLSPADDFFAFPDGTSFFNQGNDSDMEEDN